MFEDDEEKEIEELMQHNALIIATICKTVNPAINETLAADLIYEYSMEDHLSTIEDAEELGTYIRLTAGVPQSNSEH